MSYCVKLFVNFVQRVVGFVSIVLCFLLSQIIIPYCTLFVMGTKENKTNVITDSSTWMDL